MAFGEVIPGLKIDGVEAPYPVVNERAVRATAGLMFLIGICTFFYVFYTKDFTPVYYVVPAFWLDFFLKTFFGPKFSIFGFFARYFVRNQRPDYVGALQKRFAWAIGLVLASIMMIGPIGFGVRGLLPLSICTICLFFMWLETAFGICVGCKIYGFLLKKGIMKEPEFKPACPGGACSIQ
jgi:hypothetical protein